MEGRYRVSEEKSFRFSNYESKEGDYLKKIKVEDENGNTIPNTIPYGLVEVQNRRSFQEDAMVIPDEEMATYLGAMLENLDAKEISDIFQETLNEIQARFGNHPTIGSAIVSVNTTLDPETNEAIICTSNLGNSAAFLFAVNDQGELVRAERLTQLHEPTAVEELSRLSKVPFRFALDENIKTVADFVHLCTDLAEGKVTGRGYNLAKHLGKLPSNETNESLGLSRGLGNTAFNDTGYIQEAETKIEKISLQDESSPEGKPLQAYIAVTCDGAWENYKGENFAHDLGKLVTQELRKLREENKTETADEMLHLAKCIVASALDAGSGDNISAAFFPVGGHLTLLDGNGVVEELNEYDDETNERLKYKPSDFTREISEAYYPILKQKIALALEAKKAKTSEPEKEESLSATHSRMFKQVTPMKVPSAKRTSGVDLVGAVKRFFGGGGPGSK